MRHFLKTNLIAIPLISALSAVALAQDAQPEATATSSATIGELEASTASHPAPTTTAAEPVAAQSEAPVAAPAPEPAAKPEPAAAPEPQAEADSSIPGWPLKVGASVFTRFEMRQGYDKLGRSGGRFTEGEFIVYRARLRLDTAAIDIGRGQSVTLRFAPQVDGFWGNQPSTVSNPNLGVNEAYLRLSNDLFKLDVGHFMMNYGDALVIGNLGWHQTARSFDGARVRFAPKGSKYWVDVFATRLGEGIGGPDASPFAGDVVFTGIYADFGKLLTDKTVLEPYLLGQIWGSQDNVAVDPADPTMGTTTQQGAAQGTFGVRAKQSYGMFDVRLELGLQFGKRRAGFNNVSVFAYQIDGEVGVKPIKGLRLGLEGLIASGDDPNSTKNEAWSQLYPTAHKFLGLMDIMGGRSNVASGVFHLAYSGIERFVFKADAHVFVRPQTVAGQKSYAGTELDLNAIYILGKGLKLRVMYAVFVPGSSHFGPIDPTAASLVAPADNVAHYVETQFGYDF